MGGDAEDPSHVQVAEVLRAVLTEAEAGGRAAGGVRAVIVTEQVEQALRRAEVGRELDGWQWGAVEGDRAPTGGRRCSAP